jgi:predicted phage gp36 major capsid-like protein
MMLQGLVEAETDEDKSFIESKNQPDQPSAEMLLAVAEQGKADAAAAEVQRKAQADQLTALNNQQKQQIDSFRAQTDRMDTQIDAQEANATINNKNIDTIGKQIDNRQKVIQTAINGF